MVFSSLLFLFLFLPVVLVLYFAAPRTLRNLVLFVASLIFYAWGEPVYVVLMLFSTVFDYTMGIGMEYARNRNSERMARGFLLGSVVVNLALLGFFKYADFILGNINALFGTAIPLLELGLPIGISFYTFQTMSYSIDVYRKKASVQHNIISFGAYVALFPQLIAGPIVQYKTIEEQLNDRSRESVDHFSDGVGRFMSGLGKKVLLANNIGYLWSLISASPAAELTTVMAWLGILAFSFQIYFDFSGYSDMAIGLGRIFGFHFLENFEHPYVSRSITEFWRRWHISLGTWFREYVYIPLGGNRCGLVKQLRNIAVVWLLTGIWHGASWNFVVWGAYFGVLLLLEKTFLLRRLQQAPAVVGHAYTLFLVIISWVIFAFDDLSLGMAYLGAMFSVGEAGFCDSRTLYYLVNYLPLLLILGVAATPWPHRMAQRFLQRLAQNGKAVPAAICKNAAFVGVFLLSVAYLVNASYNPFLYFRF